MASDHLRERGYRIVEHNYRSRFGEIDLIAIDRDTLAFIEVRCRKAGSIVSPLESITAAKRKRLTKTALIYLSSNDWPAATYRFDVVAIETGEDGGPERVEVIKSAFDPV